MTTFEATFFYFCNLLFGPWFRNWHKNRLMRQFRHLKLTNHQESFRGTFCYDDRKYADISVAIVDAETTGHYDNRQLVPVVEYRINPYINAKEIVDFYAPNCPEVIREKRIQRVKKKLQYYAEIPAYSTGKAIISSKIKLNPITITAEPLLYQREAIRDEVWVEMDKILECLMWNKYDSFQEETLDLQFEEKDLREELFELGGLSYTETKLLKSCLCGVRDIAEGAYDSKWFLYSQVRLDENFTNDVNSRNRISKEQLRYFFSETTIRKYGFDNADWHYDGVNFLVAYFLEGKYGPMRYKFTPFDARVTSYKGEIDDDPEIRKFSEKDLSYIDFAFECGFFEKTKTNNTNLRSFNKKVKDIPWLEPITAGMDLDAAERSEFIFSLFNEKEPLEFAVLYSLTNSVTSVRYEIICHNDFEFIWMTNEHPDMTNT